MRKLVLENLYMPSINRYFEQFIKLRNSSLDLVNNDNIISKQYDVITHDGSVLNTTRYIHKDRPENKPYIIYLCGNGETYQGYNNEFFCELAEKHNANIITFNYRNLDKNHNIYSSQDFVTDAYTQVQLLLKMGIAPERINLFGHSVGGGIATLAAAELAQEGYKIGLINDRSFSDIAAPLPGHINNPILRYALYGIIKLGLFVSDFSMNVTKAWNSIKEENKILFFAPRDKVITKFAGLAGSVDIKKNAACHKIGTDEMMLLQSNVSEFVANDHNEPFTKIINSKKYSPIDITKNFVEKRAKSLSNEHGK